MTVSVNPPINTSVANGVTSVFPYSFKVLKNTDMRVLVNGVVRTEGVHYTLSGVGTESGNITFQPGYIPPNNAVVSRRRLMAFERSTDYVNLGDLLAATLNADQDAPVMMIQQLAAMAMQLIEDGEGGFVWDAKNSRIINVGTGIDVTDAANIGNVLTLLEQVQTGGGVVGVQPKYWEIAGNGEDSDFTLDGADVDNPLLYLVVIGGEVVEPYDGFNIESGNGSTQRVLRFPAALPDLTEGFVVLTGYARPYIGPPPITTVAPTVITDISTSTTLSGQYQNTLILINSASDITLTMRANTGHATDDWGSGEGFSVAQLGVGQVTLVAEGAGTVTPSPGFSAKTRGAGSVISATCHFPDAGGWLASGDLERVTASPVKQSFIVAASDETTNLTTGTGKVTFRLPYGFLLDSVRASLSTAQASGSVLTVDINRNGTSILSTKLTFDNAEKTTVTASTPPVFAGGGDVLYDDDEITIDIDQVGTAGAKGLKVALIGSPAS